MLYFLLTKNVIVYSNDTTIYRKPIYQQVIYLFTDFTIRDLFTDKTLP